MENISPNRQEIVKLARSVYPAGNSPLVFFDGDTAREIEGGRNDSKSKVIFRPDIRRIPIYLDVSSGRLAFDVNCFSFIVYDSHSKLGE